MQLDLLETRATEETGLQPESLLSQLVVVGNPGNVYSMLWEDYQDFVSRRQKDLSQMAEKENTLLPGRDKLRSVIKTMQKHDCASILGDVANQIFDRLIAEAMREFVPKGVTVKLDDQAARRVFGMDKDVQTLVDRFDPLAIWSYLAQTYGNGAGANLAWQQAAEEVIKEFGLERKTEVVMKAGYVVLTDTVSMDDHYKRFHSQNRLTHYAQTGTLAACKALAKFAGWADRSSLKDDLEARGMAWNYGGESSCIESGAKISCGEKGEVIIVTFCNKFEYRLRQDVAEQLQIFLATFGSMGGE